MTPALTVQRPSLTDLGLDWLAPLEDADLYHTALITDLFGADVYWELLERMTATTVFPQWLCAVLLDDYLAYCLARATLTDLNEPLVACLLPDQAQHVFLLYDEQRIALHHSLAGDLIWHDPAGESALVNRTPDIEKTRGIMDANGIGYHDLLWQDDVRFPDGAVCIPTGIMTRTAAFGR